MRVGSLESWHHDKVKLYQVSGFFLPWNICIMLLFKKAVVCLTTQLVRWDISPKLTMYPMLSHAPLVGKKGEQRAKWWICKTLTFKNDIQKILAHWPRKKIAACMWYINPNIYIYKAKYYKGNEAFQIIWKALIPIFVSFCFVVNGQRSKALKFSNVDLFSFLSSATQVGWSMERFQGFSCFSNFLQVLDFTKLLGHLGLYTF